MAAVDSTPLTRLSARLLGSGNLRKTGFPRLWAGETVSQAGTQVTMLAIPLIGVLTLQAGPVAMGFLIASASAANLVFGLSIGAVADRFDRRLLMQAANVGRVALLLLIVGLYAADLLAIWSLAAIAFLLGALDLLFESAFSAYVLGLVGERNLMAANSRMQASVAVAEVGGPGLGGVLVQALSGPVALVVDAVTYVGSMLALRRLPSIARERDDAATDSQPPSHLQEIKDGLRFVLRDAVQRPLAVAAAHFNLFTSMFFAIYVLYLVRELGFSPIEIAAMTMVGGASGLVAAAAAARIDRALGTGRALIVVYTLPGLAAACVPLAGSQGSHVLALALVAVSNAFWAGSVVVNLTLSQTLTQTLVDESKLSRTFATTRFMAWGVEPLGGALGGVLAATALGLRGTLALSCVGLATASAWLALSAVRTTRLDLGEEAGS